MDEPEFAQEVAQMVKEYREFKGQEAPHTPPLKAGRLPPEVKEQLGLDVFPEDIQDQILALGQKVADYILELEEQAGQEAPALPYMQKMINCWGDMPSRAIHQDALNACRQIWNSPAMKVGPLKPLRLPLAIGGYGAGLLGGAAGWLAGCPRR